MSVSVPDITLHVAEAAVIFTQTHDHVLAVKRAISAHRKAHPEGCEVQEAKYGPDQHGLECYSPNYIRPREEWCSYCIEQHRLWTEQENAKRAMKAAERRLFTQCAKVDGLAWLQ